MLMKYLMIMLVLIASSAYGEIYRWTDSRGTIHFTNSSYEIPERYRSRAKTVNLGIQEQKTDQASPPQTASAPVTPQPPSFAEPSSPTSLPAVTPPKTDVPQPKAILRTNKSFKPSRHSRSDE
jgi:hypothetical protein